MSDKSEIVSEEPVEDPQVSEDTENSEDDAVAVEKSETSSEIDNDTAQEDTANTTDANISDEISQKSALPEDDTDTDQGSEDDEESDDTEEETQESEASDDSDEPDEEEGELFEDEFQLPIDQVVEAILFSSDKPLKLEKIAKAAGRGVRREKVREAIDQLNAHYNETNRSFEIVEIAETFQFMSRPEFARNIQRLHGKKAQKEDDKSRKLSPAALDTLAIIAYKQPVTRADVEAVRGVGCGQIMRQLMERGSVRPVGKKMDVIGYPLLYGTTREFLEEFGLASLEQLPMINEMRRITGSNVPLPDPNSEETQQAIPMDDEDLEDNPSRTENTEEKNEEIESVDTDDISDETGDEDVQEDALADSELAEDESDSSDDYDEDEDEDFDEDDEDLDDEYDEDEDFDEDDDESERE